LEDGLALLVADARAAQLPLDLVERVRARAGEVARDREPAAPAPLPGLGAHRPQRRSARRLDRLACAHPRTPPSFAFDPTPPRPPPARGASRPLRTRREPGSTRPLPREPSRLRPGTLRRPVRSEISTGDERGAGPPGAPEPGSGPPSRSRFASPRRPPV